ncbi:MAG: M23 family metallopeptidase [Chloroflexota bacterium]
MNLQIVKPTWKQGVLLALSLLVILSLLPLQSAYARYMEAADQAKKMNLCGRLVFIQVLDGSITMLGLVPCGETKPYIFQQRPAEIANAYRFTNAVIKSGNKVQTRGYGNLTQYITGWDSYIVLNSCGECSTGPKPTAAPPTAAPSESETPAVTISPGSALTALFHPVGTNFPISEGYGADTSVFPLSNGHSGVDFAVPIGTPIKAPADGVVVDIGEDLAGYGNFIILEHRDGSRTLYAHLSEVRVLEGQNVGAGETIALSGNSGKSSGPHLHFEYRLANMPVDPSQFLSISG